MRSRSHLTKAVSRNVSSGGGVGGDLKNTDKVAEPMDARNG